MWFHILGMAFAQKKCKTLIHNFKSTNSTVICKFNR